MKAGYNPLGQLVSEMWYDSSETLTAHYRYTYDHQGNIVRSVDILAKKEYNYSYEEGRLLRATECDITLDGAKILREQLVEGENIKQEITPLYDNEDNVCGILHCDIPYYFLKNLQGDVIAITNQRGETVARYTYDAWGACTVSYDATATPADEDAVAINIATVNPFRYRSYYFDTETGLYYLQSRYYDPNLGRFINGDEPVLNCLSAVSKGLNAFVYCNNNCVNVTDKTGYVAGVDDAAVAVVAVALIALCVVLVSLLVQLGIALSEYWVDFCHAVGNGLAWMGSAIANATIAVWRWGKKTIKTAILAVSTCITFAKAQKKAKTKIPNKLKVGNKLKTPTSHKGEFSKKRGGGYSHKKTGWEYTESKDGHYGGKHWHVRPANGQTGDYYNVTLEGILLG